MSKIQGKQISDQTILQSHLVLGNPTSGDTTSGATVNYVNEKLMSGGDVTIGPAESGDLVYTDGIFPDFNTGTTIGTAVDRFNEVLLKLAPTPPTTWSTAFVATPVLQTAAISTPRIIGTGAVTSNVVVSTLTPAFTIVSTAGLGVNARTREGSFVFTVKDYNGTVRETVTINSGSTTNLSGTILRYTIGDPYAGIAGQQNFWTGCTGFSGVSFTTNPGAGVTPRNLYFEHPNGIGRTGTTFYVDNTTHTPAATGLSVTGNAPSMTTRYVSGVPSLVAGSTLTGISFSITNVSSYFYAPLNTVWGMTGTRITTVNGDPDSIPATMGATATVTNKTATLTAGYSESIGFTVTPKNRSGVDGSTTAVTYSNLRIDTVSVETDRLTSGTGNYPTVYGSAFTSTSSLITTNTMELQLLNNMYKWPTTNYTIYGGGDYSSITTGDNISGTEWRWATFNLGPKGTVSNITITLPTATIGAAWADIKMYVKIGASGWLDASLAKNVDAPYADGDGALDVAGSTAYYIRKVTFGTVPRAGTVYARIGIKYANRATFTFAKPTIA